MYYTVDEFCSKSALEALREFYSLVAYKEMPTIRVNKDDGTESMEIPLNELTFDANTEAVLNTYDDYCKKHDIENDYPGGD